MTFPEVNTTKVNQNQQSSASNGGNNNVGQKREASIKLFFDEGLTREKVFEEFKESGRNLFDSANKDGDDVISQKEFDEYVVQSQTVNGKSGKRTAVGGIYVVQSGDTLSKIAADFGLDVDTLYRINKETIGGNKNKISIGQELRLNETGEIQNQETIKEAKKEELSKKIHNFKIPEGMKSVLSEVMGVDISSLSNEEIAENLSNRSMEDLRKILNAAMKNCPKEDLNAFKTQFSISDDTQKAAISSLLLQLTTDEGSNKIFEQLANSLGKSVDDIKNMSIKELNRTIATLPKDQRVSIMREIGNASLDEEVSIPELDGQSDAQTLFRYCGITNIEDIPKSERGKVLAEAYKAKKDADLDKTNENSFYNVSLNQLKNGEFTKQERELLRVRGISPDNVPESVLDEFATKRVHTGYLKAMNNASIDLALDKQDIENFFVHLRAVSMSDIPAEAHSAGVDTSSFTMTQAAILEDDSISEEDKQRGANVLAECSQGLGVDYLEDDQFASFSKTIYNYADEEHSTQYSNDYSSKSDILREVIQNIISNSTDSDKIDALTRVYETVNANYQNNTQTTEGLRPSGANPSAGSGYVSNPIETPSPALTIADESNRFLEERGIYQKSNEEISASRSIRRISLGMQEPDPIKYTSQKVSDMQKFVKDALTSFSTLSNDDIKILKQYLSGIASQHHNIISIMIQGNSEIQKFMLQENIISVESLINSVSEDEYNRLKDFVKEMTGKEISKDVQAGTLKPEEMSDVKRAMYEYYLKNN